MNDITNKDMAAEARREVGMRKRVYGRWVQEGRNGWTQERADRAIAVMEAIADHFDRLDEIDRDTVAPRLAL